MKSRVHVFFQGFFVGIGDFWKGASNSVLGAVAFLILSPFVIWLMCSLQNAGRREVRQAHNARQSQETTLQPALTVELESGRPVWTVYKVPAPIDDLSGPNVVWVESEQKEVVVAQTKRSDYKVGEKVSLRMVSYCVTPRNRAFIYVVNE